MAKRKKSTPANGTSATYPIVGTTPETLLHTIHTNTAYVKRQSGAIYAHLVKPEKGEFLTDEEGVKALCKTSGLIVRDL